MEPDQMARGMGRPFFARRAEAGPGRPRCGLWRRGFPDKGLVEAWAPESDNTQIRRGPNRPAQKGDPRRKTVSHQGQSLFPACRRLLQQPAKGWQAIPGEV